MLTQRAAHNTDCVIWSQGTTQQAVTVELLEPLAIPDLCFTPRHVFRVMGIARIGKGGNDRYFYGVRMMMVITQQGVATGWALAAGHVQERWVAEWLFRTRAGGHGLQGPLDEQGQQPQVTPPEE